MTASTGNTTTESKVAAVLPAPGQPNDYFERRLQYETDPSDVHTDLHNGVAGVVVLDTRPADAYLAGHVPGARSMPYYTISEETVGELDRDAVHVTYGWHPACNAGQHGAARLLRLGLAVKEMLGGLEYWRRAGYDVVTGPEPGRPEDGR